MLYQFWLPWQYSDSNCYCGGKIEQGSFWINGNFNKEFGGKGQETIIFGPVKKTIHFDPKLEEDKTNLNVTKKITGFDAKTQKLTYTITVTAPDDNTQTVKDFIRSNFCLLLCSGSYCS